MVTHRHYDLQLEKIEKECSKVGVGSLISVIWLRRIIIGRLRNAQRPVQHVGKQRGEEASM